MPSSGKYNVPQILLIKIWNSFTNYLEMTGTLVVPDATLSVLGVIPSVVSFHCIAYQLNTVYNFLWIIWQQPAINHYSVCTYAMYRETDTLIWNMNSHCWMLCLHTTVTMLLTFSTSSYWQVVITPYFLGFGHGLQYMSAPLRFHVLRS